jgi:hypothetical protein
MKAVASGFWGTSHWILDWIGRGTAWCFHTKLAPSEDMAYAMTGGAILGAVVGAMFGFILSAESHGFNAVAGMVIGGLLGLSTGIGCGAIVESVDEYIRAWLNSLNSK